MFARKVQRKHFASKLFLTFEKSVLSLSAMLVITHHPHAFEDNVNVRSNRDRRVSNDKWISNKVKTHMKEKRCLVHREGDTESQIQRNDF